jgi:hypothetical protein
MAAGRTLFAARGIFASLDDEPFARPGLGAFATCTDFASSIVLCVLREDELLAVALPTAPFARVAELVLRGMSFLTERVAAALARADSVMPLACLPLAFAFDGTFAEAMVFELVLLGFFAVRELPAAFVVRLISDFVAALFGAVVRGAARRDAIGFEGARAGGLRDRGERFAGEPDRAAAGRVTALLAFCVFERLFVTCGTRFLSRGCDGLAYRQ